VKRLLCALGLLVLGLIATPALAQSGSDAPAGAQGPPFAYTLLQTTLDEARQYWSQNGVHVLGAGHLAVGSGSGMDGLGKVSVDKVLLVDVAGVDFEGVTSARFGFYENKLYRIQAKLKPGLQRSNKAGLDYSADQLKELETRLRQKYGNPNEMQHTLYADKGQKNDLLVWRIDGNKLTFVSNTLDASLVLSNERTEAEIKKYIKEYCKTVNTQGHIVCW
jgi:hypothetical protein